MDHRRNNLQVLQLQLHKHRHQHKLLQCRAQVQHLQLSLRNNNNNNNNNNDHQVVLLQVPLLSTPTPLLLLHSAPLMPHLRKDLDQQAQLSHLMERPLWVANLHNNIQARLRLIAEAAHPTMATLHSRGHRISLLHHKATLRAQSHIAAIQDTHIILAIHNLVSNHQQGQDTHHILDHLGAMLPRQEHRRAMLHMHSMVHLRVMRPMANTAHRHLAVDTLHLKEVTVGIVHHLLVTKWALLTLVALQVHLVLILGNTQGMIKVVDILGPIRGPLKEDPSLLHNKVSKKEISN